MVEWKRMLFWWKRGCGCGVEKGLKFLCVGVWEERAMKVRGQSRYFRDWESTCERGSSGTRSSDRPSGCMMMNWSSGPWNLNL